MNDKTVNEVAMALATNVNSLNSSALSAIDVVDTIAKLRALEPTEAGSVVVVMEYETSYKSGGGIFIYDATDTTSKEDYGVTVVTPKGARWKRYVNDYNDVNVEFFGAIADGKTDCLQAVTRMWNWSQANEPEIGIKFPAGNFMLSKFDISSQTVSHFRLTGY